MKLLRDFLLFLSLAVLFWAVCYLITPNAP